MGILLNTAKAIRAYQTGKEYGNQDNVINVNYPEKLPTEEVKEMPFAFGVNGAILINAVPEDSTKSKSIYSTYSDKFDKNNSKIKSAEVGVINNVREGSIALATPRGVGPTMNAEMSMYSGDSYMSKVGATNKQFADINKLNDNATNIAAAVMGMGFAKKKIVFSKNIYNNIDSFSVNGQEHLIDILANEIVDKSAGKLNISEVRKGVAFEVYNLNPSTGGFRDLTTTEDDKPLAGLKELTKNLVDKFGVDLTNLEFADLAKAYKEPSININTGDDIYTIPTKYIKAYAKYNEKTGKYEANLGDVLNAYTSSLENYTSPIDKATLNSLPEDKYNDFMNASLFAYAYNNLDDRRVLGEIALTGGAITGILPPTPFTKIATGVLSLVGTGLIASKDFNSVRVSKETAWKDLLENIGVTAMNLVSAGAAAGAGDALKGMKMYKWFGRLASLRKFGKTGEFVSSIWKSKLYKYMTIGGWGALGVSSFVDVYNDRVNNELDLSKGAGDIRDMIYSVGGVWGTLSELKVMKNVINEATKGVKEGTEAVEEAAKTTNETKGATEAANEANTNNETGKSAEAVKQEANTTNEVKLPKPKKSYAVMKFLISSGYAKQGYNVYNVENARGTIKYPAKKLTVTYNGDVEVNDKKDLIEKLNGGAIYLYGGDIYVGKQQANDYSAKYDPNHYDFYTINLDSLGFKDEDEFYNYLKNASSKRGLVDKNNRDLKLKINVVPLRVTYKATYDNGNMVYKMIQRPDYYNSISITDGKIESGISKYAPMILKQMGYYDGTMLIREDERNDINAKQKGGSIDWENLAVTAGANALSNVISYKKPEKIINDEYMQEVNNPRLKAAPLFYSYMPNMSLQPKKITEAEKNAYKGILINNMPETHTNSLTQNRNTERANAMKLNDQMTKFKMNEISSVQQQETQKASQALKNLANTVATDNKNEQSIYQSKIADATNFKNFLQSYYQNKLNFATLKNKDTIDSIQYMLDLFLNKGKEPLPSSYYKKDTTDDTTDTQ